MIEYTLTQTYLDDDGSLLASGWMPLDRESLENFLAGEELRDEIIEDITISGHHIDRLVLTHEGETMICVSTYVWLEHPLQKARTASEQ